MFRRVALCALAVACAFGQSFDVASIKPTADKTGQFMLRRPENGVFRASGVTLKMLIMTAYEINAYQVAGGPGWIGTERWDIEAKTESAAPGFMPREQEIPMLRALLEDRFQLKARRETREMPVYELAIAKNGPKLVTYSHDVPGSPQPISSGSIRFQKARVSRLAGRLSILLGRSVIDKTGLTGEYDITLNWTPAPGQTPPEAFGLPPQTIPVAPSGDTDGPSIFTALQEQLGLRLDSAKGPVDMIVIESVAKPSEN